MAPITPYAAWRPASSPADRRGACTGQTGAVTGELQATVAARIPGAAALGLVVPPSAPLVPASRLADPGWTAGLLGARGGRGVEPRVAATVWWYSVSAVLVTPALAGLVAGVPLSGRLADTSLVFRSDGLPVAALSARGSDPASELRDAVASVVAALAEVGRMRERPLWAIATDSIANQLLALGRAVGDVGAATAIAAPLAAAIGAPLPVPRYIDVGGARFTRRASCCLIDQASRQPRCISCPRHPPAERASMLQQAARWF